MNVSPNTTGLPGISELENIVGALLTIALIASLAGLVYVRDANPTKGAL